MKLSFVALGIGILISIFYFFESDEKYLRRTTENLIQLVSPPFPPARDLSLLSRVEKLGKRMRFDIQFKLHKPRGGIYEANSAHKLRSALLAYFEYKWVGRLKAGKILVQIGPEKQAQVSFEAQAIYRKKSLVCQILLKWIKEKRAWYIKEIEVKECVLSDDVLEETSVSS